MQCKRLDPIKKDLTIKQVYKILKKPIKKYPGSIDSSKQ
jgi:hypothetical protein